MKKLYFEVKNGKINGFFPKIEDGLYEIKERKRVRSHEFNRLYWGYIIKFVVLQFRDAGYMYTKDYVHSCFKRAFLKRIRIKSDFSKKFIMKEGTTMNLSNKEFMEFIEHIQAVCEFGELGKVPGLVQIEAFVIPEPDEEELMEWIDKIV